MNRSVLFLLALAASLLSSCLFWGSRTISGRLDEAFGCLVVREGGKTYELTRWPRAVPPLGAFVVLKIKLLRGYASTCQVGEIAEVVRVVRIITDFRTEPVIASETWGPGQSIVLGRVEVAPGATLTILPGTTVRIISYGELRVRGTLRMVGTPAESVHISGGPMVLDSAGAASRVAYASVQGIVVHGTGPDLEHLLTSGIGVRDGSVTIRNCRLRYGVTGYNGRITAVQSDVGAVSMIGGDITIANARLERLELSYSHASVQDSHFGGERTYVLFHGASGGVFQRNVFGAPVTDVVVRHTSDPVFNYNDFLSAPTRVLCESRDLPSCVHLERNWWGTTDEERIRTNFPVGCPVCYQEWLSGPFRGSP